MRTKTNRAAGGILGTVTWVLDASRERAEGAIWSLAERAKTGKNGARFLGFLPVSTRTATFGLLPVQEMGRPWGAAMTQTIAIDLFRPQFLSLGGRAVDLRHGKAGALLACAVLSQSFRVSRANLATLLWSDTTDQRARSSLRQTIARLRRDAPAALEDFVNFEGPDISLKLDRGAVAHLRLLDKVREGHVDAEAFADVGVPTGFCASLLDLTEEMDRFVLQERTIYFDDLQAALGDVVEAHDSEARCEAARILKRLDATNETARRAIMRHLADSGEVAAAIREFEDLQALLDTEFDVDPSPETVELHADIKMGRLASAPSPRPLARVRSLRAIR